ncbi:hypothetical protein MKX03_004578 [Papaver bracteatum]|nr:hypothetical protein MKX03_004578 [Papaver bracteatum]
MENLCKLHVWGIRESPRRVFDAVLFSNEVDLLQVRHWCSLVTKMRSNLLRIGSLMGLLDEGFRNGENPFVEEAYQRVALGQLLRVTWIMDDELLMTSDVDEIPSRRTINLFRCCGDIPQTILSDVIGKLGPIPHSYTAVHLPAYVLIVHKFWEIAKKKLGPITVN